MFGNSFLLSAFNFQFLGALEGESPDHSRTSFVVDVVGVDDGEEAEISPLVDVEFVEERYGVAGLYGVKERLIGSVEFLIAAAAGSGVVDDVGGFAVEIRVAGIDSAEVGEQRYQTAIALVDAVANPVHLGDALPKEDIADVDLI